MTASLLTPPQIQREAGRERDTEVERERIERGQKGARAGQRQGERERRVKGSQKIYLTVWVCEVSRHAS